MAVHALSDAVNGCSAPPFLHDVNDAEISAESRLANLLKFLQTSQGVRIVQAAHRDMLRYKEEQYTRLCEEAECDVEKERALISAKMPELKATSMVQGDQDNWLIFESISKAYIEAKNRSSVFDALRRKARAHLMAYEVCEEGRDMGLDHARALSAALEQLFNFRSQIHIIGTVVDIVSAFLKNPRLVRTKFMNFIMVGAAGTGKTTLATVMSKCFASAGMFVGDRVVTAGRAELVAEYEGQTVARTRNFLVSNLDCGVIFIDEAYGITQWSDGRPDSYGSEAVTAMVEFMSKFKGLYCIIAAGYEKEMKRYFLATNPGIERRFPYRFVMRDLAPSQLTHVFERTLLTEQGCVPPPGGESAACDAFVESHRCFTTRAWGYLTALIAYSMGGRVDVVPDEYDRATRQTYTNIRVFSPAYPHMYRLFMNQAGSMTNLAEECATVLMMHVPFRRDARRSPPVLPRNLDVAVMRRVIQQRIMNSALSDAPAYLREWSVIDHQIVNLHGA